MDRKKIILSVIGLAALVIPVVLLLLFSSKSEKQPEVPAGERKIDPQTVEEVTKKNQSPLPILPSPSPATTSAQLEVEGSPSAR